MFLCDKCHASCGALHFGGSYGPCEGCGHVASCVDCNAHHQKREAAPTPKPPVPDSTVPSTVTAVTSLRRVLTDAIEHDRLNYSEDVSSTPADRRIVVKLADALDALRKVYAGCRFRLSSRVCCGDMGVQTTRHVHCLDCMTSLDRAISALLGDTSEGRR